ncbi:unnamed protein product [Adineta steineri]|uniref:Rab-GAP TBC domain-containing protein n=1 Tax=Adineta steineri TaxID=433720 RepID=A0A814PDP8_9BILA|nr:unnamed protein product [Adineta steineri]
MAATTYRYRSHSSEHFPSSKVQLPKIHSSRSTGAIDIKSILSSTSSSSFSLDNETKNENVICSSLSTRPSNLEYFRKSNSLDSGYKTLSAASHGTSHTDTIDEENERHNSFLQIASSPSSCSSSSYVVSNTNNNQKINSKIEFIVVDDEDDVDDKLPRLSRKNSKSNADGLSSGGDRRSRKNSLSNYSVSNYSVLLNEFCCTSSDKIDETIIDEKTIKKRSGFANTVATFFSSKKKEDEQPSMVTPTKRIQRSRSVSEASLERTTINQDSIETVRTLSIETTDDQIDSETISTKLPTTTTYTIPSKPVKISTQSLLTTSSSSTTPTTPTNNNQQTSSLSWLYRLSNRFNPSTATTRSTTKTSSTGLIFENRPTNLPPKSDKETLKHQVEYQKMCLEAKRAQQLYDEKEEQRQHLKLKREEFVSKSLKIWTNEILPYWDRYHSINNCPDLLLNSKAYKLWWHGLPPRIRGKVWKMAIGNELGLTYELFTQLQQMAKEKLEEAKQAEDARSNHSASPQLRTTTITHASETTSSYIELIQLDVSRTFPQLGIFQQNGPYHEYLQLLLCIYVYFCPEIGYVQGQAFLAAMFLLNLDLFDSFICFSNLLNRPYFQTFYRFNNIEKYLELFNQLLNYHLPKLSAHFIQMSIEPNCFALDWFFTIYSKSLPLDVVSRIWDIFFRDGDAFIFRTAIAILSLYEERLCQLDTFHCLQFLTRLPDDLNVTSLFKAIDKINFDHTNCELFYLIA